MTSELETMNVRAANEADVDALAQIWHDGWHDAHARIVPAELARLRTLKSFRDRLTPIWVPSAFSRPAAPS